MQQQAVLEQLCGERNSNRATSSVYSAVQEISEKFWLVSYIAKDCKTQFVACKMTLRQNDS